MPYDWYHTAKLASPKSTHPLHIPDKASVYWVDYLLDQTPHQITNADELYNYYERSFNKYQRTERLAEPKPWPTYECGRATTANGISVSALKYVPSQRIRELATPVTKEKSSKKLQGIMLPPVGEKYKVRTDKWHDESLSTLDSAGVFARRHPAYEEIRRHTPGRNYGYDLSGGDFRSRSRPNRNRRPETTDVPKLPPIDEYDPRHRHYKHRPPLTPFSQTSSGKSPVLVACPCHQHKRVRVKVRSISIGYITTPPSYSHDVLFGFDIHNIPGIRRLLLVNFVL